MAATGLLFETDQHAEQLVAFAEALVEAAGQVRTPLGNPVSMRVGIHSGRVMSGIVGTLRSRYCLFGGPSCFDRALRSILMVINSSWLDTRKEDGFLNFLST
jgi:hypothetical protein